MLQNLKPKNLLVAVLALTTSAVNLTMREVKYEK